MPINGKLVKVSFFHYHERLCNDEKNEIDLYLLLWTNSRAYHDTFVQMKKRKGAPFQADPVFTREPS
jgi:hypothetical protein